MTNEQIRIAWDEAEEIHSSLDELTDEEIIEILASEAETAINNTALGIIAF